MEEDARVRLPERRLQARFASSMGTCIPQLQTFLFRGIFCTGGWHSIRLPLWWGTLRTPNPSSGAGTAFPTSGRCAHWCPPSLDTLNSAFWYLTPYLQMSQQIWQHIFWFNTLRGLCCGLWTKKQKQPSNFWISAGRYTHGTVKMCKSEHGRTIRGPW